jgi:hypothetical protein
MRRIIQGIVTAGVVCVGAAQAGSFFFDFNTDPTLNGLLTINGSGSWQASGGAGAATNANDGYLVISSGTSQSTTIIFSDFDAGSVVQGFTFEADLRIGNGTLAPADGFSVNYCRATDPVLTGGAFATGPNCEANLPEEGTQTGIGIGFDAWPSGGSPPYCDEANQSIGPDIAAVTVRVDGILVLQNACPTANPTNAADPTSVQTGPYDGSGDPTILSWEHLKVQLTIDAKLSVWWKGTQILSNYQTTFFPSPGRLVFAGRCGGSWENQDLDNISITTIAATTALVGAASGFPDGFSIPINDSGNSVIDITKPVTTTFNGVSVTPTSVTKNGSTTTIIYHNFPVLLPVGSTNVVIVAAKDVNGNTITGTRSFVEGAYAIIPAGDVVTTGVNTSLPGFRLQPWQSPNTAGVGEPNNVYWAQEQLMGLHGANNADLSSATDGGYIDYTNVLNFNVWASSGDIGDFTTANGFTDSTVPGIPGANGLTGSIALEALTFLNFTKPGIYTMGVNSDDGFCVTEGKNPRDRLALVLGQYDGGRGSSDTTFIIAVTNAGIYPVRLIYENGAGEGTGNGANLEWFMVDTNGAKILVNDPSSTNDTGVTAYYSGPALPPFVSFINPYIGTTRAWPHQVLVQLTDGATTVNGSSIKLGIDGSTTPAAVISKSGAVTTATLSLFNQPLTIGAHTATLVWADSAGTAHSNNWSFTVESYVVADSSQAVPASGVDTTQPGFALHVAQLDPNVVGDSGDSTANQVDWANAMLAGTCFPWYGYNVVDTNNVPSVSSNLWYWTQAIDFNDVTSAGDFTFDYLTPGIPGTTGSVDYYAKGFDGWLVFPQPGYYRMSISSDDGFRVSPGIGLLRQVLHIKGAKVERDVAAVVSDTTYGNGGIGTPPPIVPITAPVVFVSTNNYTPGQAINLTNKIAAVDGGLYGVSDPLLCYIAQTNGALAIINVWNPAYGLPYVMGAGSTPAPITIPTIMVNGYGGERNTWITNTDLTATIGASQNQIWGSADYGKGMGRIDFPVMITTAGAYPLHVTYFQGGGGAGMEWQTYQYGQTLDSTNMVLIDDATVPTALAAYRAVKVLPTPTLSVGKQGSSYVITYTGVLRSSATANGTYQPVAGASNPYTIPTSAAPMMFYRAYQN